MRSKRIRFATLFLAAGFLLPAENFVSAQPPEGGPPRGEERRMRRGPGDERGPMQNRGPSDRGPMRGGAQMMMRIPVIAALDADRDGVISSAEIENAAVALKKLDKNNDGKIDAEEMRPQGMAGQDRLQRGRPGTEPQRGRPGMDTERGGRPGAGGDGDAAGRGAAGRGGAMLDRLMQQDKDGDGMLSGSEIPERMAAMMDRADSNSDGKLSREEIETAMKARMGRGGAREGRGPRGGGDTPGGERPRRPPTGEDPAV